MESQHSTSSREWSGTSTARRRIVFVGYGIEAERIGPALGNRPAEITVIESDRVRADSARTAGYQVIEGDASDVGVLREARVDVAEIVAMTSLDLGEEDVRAIRRVRPTGMILTNLPKGYDQPDALSAMMRRILRILDSSQPGIKS